MRPIWLLTVLFIGLGVLGVCRTPEAPPTPGCMRMASGLERCPPAALAP